MDTSSPPTHTRSPGLTHHPGLSKNQTGIGIKTNMVTTNILRPDQPEIVTTTLANPTLSLPDPHHTPLLSSTLANYTFPHHSNASKPPKRQMSTQDEVPIVTAEIFIFDSHLHTFY
jgi:hypothetical protein